MKKVLNTFLALGIILSAFVFVSCPSPVVKPTISTETEDVAIAAPIHFYVDENGTDNGTGTQEKPFASVQAAVDAIDVHNYNYNGNRLRYVIHVSGTITEDDGSNNPSMITINPSETLYVTIQGFGETGGTLDASAIYDATETKLDKRVLTITGDNARVTLGSNLIITGGTFSAGAGVYVGNPSNPSDTAVLTIDGAVIKGNTSDNYGAGIRIVGGSEVIFKSGSVTENTVTGTNTNVGAGIYVNANGILKLEGSPVVTGNVHDVDDNAYTTLDNAASNIAYEYNDPTDKGMIYISGALSADASIGITPDLSDISGYAVITGTDIPSLGNNVTTYNYTITQADADRITRDDDGTALVLVNSDGVANTLVTKLPSLTYYVETNGNDDVENTEGDEDTPFASVQRAFEVIASINDGRDYTIYVTGTITNSGDASSGTVHFGDIGQTPYTITLKGTDDGGIISGDKNTDDTTPYGTEPVITVGSDDLNLILGENLTISGGTIGVDILQGTVTVNGATITKNAGYIDMTDPANPVTIKGGGIRVDTDLTTYSAPAILRLAKDAEVTGNFETDSETTRANIVKSDDGVIYVTEALTKTVGITLGNDTAGELVASGEEYTLTADDLAKFERDNAKKDPLQLYGANNAIYVKLEQTEWYVSENGSDENDGKLPEKAFATLFDAVEVISKFEDGRTYTITIEGSVDGTPIALAKDKKVLNVELKGTGTIATVLTIGDNDPSANPYDDNLVVTLQDGLTLTGGVVVANDAKFVMNGSIIKNAATGVEVNSNATFVMTGGEISNNSTEGVYVASGAELKLSGSSVIKNNGGATATNVVYDYSDPSDRGNIYIVGDLTADAHVGITTANTDGGHVVATGADHYTLSDATYADRLVPDNGHTINGELFSLELIGNTLQVPYLPTTYYVSSADDGGDGDNNNPGTLAHPFETVQTAVNRVLEIGDGRSYTINIIGTVVTAATIEIDSSTILTDNKTVNITFAGENSVITGDPDLDALGGVDYGAVRILHVNGADVNVTINDGVSIEGGYHATKGAGIYIESGTVNVYGAVTGNATAGTFADPDTTDSDPNYVFTSYNPGAGVYVEADAILNVGENANITGNRTGGFTGSTNDDLTAVPNRSDIETNIAYAYTSEVSRGRIYVNKPFDTTASGISITTPLTIAPPTINPGSKGDHIVVFGPVSNEAKGKVKQDGFDKAVVMTDDRGFEVDSAGNLVRTKHGTSFTVADTASSGIYDSLNTVIGLIKGFDDDRTYTITVSGAINNDNIVTIAHDKPLNIIIKGGNNGGSIFPMAFNGSGAPGTKLTDAGQTPSAPRSNPHTEQKDIYGNSRVFEIDGLNVNVTLENITISGGRATNSHGGGVLLKNGTLTLGSGAVIQNSIAWSTDSENTPAYGGGVYVEHGTLVLNGGSIENNYAYADIANSLQDAVTKGGGVYVENGSLFLNSGSITKNKVISDTATDFEFADYYHAHFDLTAAEYGALIHFSYDDALGATANDDKDAFGYGAGVYIEHGGMKMSGGTIGDNTIEATSASDTEGYGAGVYLGDGSSFNMSNGEIVTNKTDTSSTSGIAQGSGVYTRGSFIMTNGKISGNIFDGQLYATGADVYTAAGTTRLTGGTVGSKASAE